MEKIIVRWSYLAGLSCAVLALVWRAIAALGWTSYGVGPGTVFSYTTLLKGAVLLFLMCIATSTYATAQKA